MGDALLDLLADLDICPVLVDIGASGSPPEIWRTISRRSIYVGFDPDLREVREIPEGEYHRSWILNAAVTAQGGGETRFFLTKSPHCSSTLPPDHESLSDFLYSDLFRVERTRQVPAVTLDEALARLSLGWVDWLKLDTQGTDLRIFKSMAGDSRRRVLALDIEPGLIDAYRGEDLFVESHRELTREGFWLSDVAVKGTVRMRRSTLSEIGGLPGGPDEDLVRRTVRTTPGWCDARYLRRFEGEHGPRDVRDFVLLWVFSVLDGQEGFALDLALEYRRRFGADAVFTRLLDIPLRRIREAARRGRYRETLRIPARVLRRIRRTWRGKR
jgi:FkbM family methyltransferase